MPSYNKSFNFRNGVQVDDDNFIVNPNGLVGIGTSIPREFLDVHGTAKITGLVTARNLAVTGVSTFYSDVKIGSGITVYASTGIISATAFYGDGSNLLNVEQVAVDGWIVNAGNISTTSKVGIGTTLPYHSLQVGQNPLTGNGFLVDAITGNVYTTGIITASRFSGPGDGVTDLNASAITSGTLDNTRLPQNINVSGILTAYSFTGFGTNLQGINATNITNGTLSNSRLAQNVSISGIISAPSGIITSLTSTNLNNTGIATLGIVTVSQLYVSGVTTSLQGFVGNVTGIASTALSLSGTPNISVANINSSNINNTGIITSLFSSIGVSTVSTRLYAERIGVGTNSPSGDIDIHIRRNGQSRLQVTSDTAEAIIAVGRSVTLIGSNGALIFGNTSGIYQYSNSKTLDIVNYDTGSLNHYLHYGISGVGTGNFNWIYGQNANNPLMSLTYQGNLGIGVTNPTNKLQVSGSISASSLSLSGNITATGNISATGNITATGAGTSTSVGTLYVYGGKSQILNLDGTQIFPPGDVGSNLNVTSGVSTFYDINVTGTGFFNQGIGIGNTNPQGSLHIGESTDSVLITPFGIGLGTDNISNAGAFLYSPDYSAIFSAIGIGTTTVENPNTNLYVVGNSEFYGGVGIGTTNPTSKLTVRGGDISVGTNNSHGVILTSPNGTQYRLRVNNAGDVSAVAV